jgi:hypothetical protein
MIGEQSPCQGILTRCKEILTEGARQECGAALRMWGGLERSRRRAGLSNSVTPVESLGLFWKRTQLQFWPFGHWCNLPLLEHGSPWRLNTGEVV